MVRGKWLLFSVTVILIGVGAGAVSLLHRERQTQARPAEKPAAVDVSLPARVQARHMVSVGAEISGEIQELPVEPGQEVSEGEVLARIANQGLRSTEESATAATDFAQSHVNKIESSITAARMEASRARAAAFRARLEMDRQDKVYRRQKTLVAEGATPRLAYEKTEREYTSVKNEFDSLDVLAKQAEERIATLEGELENARKALADKLKVLEDAQAGMAAAEIRSPVNGLLVARRAEIGKTVGPGAGNEIFDIAVDLSVLQAVVEAEPSALERVRPGQPAMVFLADIPAEGVPGIIREVKGNQALVDFNSPSALVKPGMSAQVRLRLE